MKTKPYGIFEIFDDSITISQLEKTLNSLSDHITLCRKGKEDGIWTWEENFVSVSNYIQIMKNELKSLSTHSSGKSHKKRVKRKGFGWKDVFTE